MYIVLLIYIPVDAVVVEDVTSLLVIFKNVAITLTLQLLPGAAENV